MKQQCVNYWFVYELMCSRLCVYLFVCLLLYLLIRSLSICLFVYGFVLCVFAYLITYWFVYLFVCLFGSLCVSRVPKWAIFFNCLEWGLGDSGAGWHPSASFDIRCSRLRKPFDSYPLPSDEKTMLVFQHYLTLFGQLPRRLILFL